MQSLAWHQLRFLPVLILASSITIRFPNNPTIACNLRQSPPVSDPPTPWPPAASGDPPANSCTKPSPPSRATSCTEAKAASSDLITLTVNHAESTDFAAPPPSTCRRVLSNQTVRTLSAMSFCQTVHPKQSSISSTSSPSPSHLIQQSMALQSHTHVKDTSVQTPTCSAINSCACLRNSCTQSPQPCSRLIHPHNHQRCSLDSSTQSSRVSAGIINTIINVSIDSSTQSPQPCSRLIHPHNHQRCSLDSSTQSSRVSAGIINTIINVSIDSSTQSPTVCTLGP